MSFLNRVAAAFGTLTSRKRLKAARKLAAVVRGMRKDYEDGLEELLSQGLPARPYGPNYFATSKVTTYLGELGLTMSAVADICTLQLTIHTDSKPAFNFARAVIALMVNEIAPLNGKLEITQDTDDSYTFSVLIAGVSPKMATKLTRAKY